MSSKESVNDVKHIACLQKSVGILAKLCFVPCTIEFMHSGYVGRNSPSQVSMYVDNKIVWLSGACIPGRDVIVSSNELLTYLYSRVNGYFFHA